MNTQPRQPYAVPDDFFLEEWLVQPTLGRMLRKGTVVPLRPQLMDLLVCLASRPGRTVLKPEVVDIVWEGRYISETSLARTVCELRGILGDEARNPRVIETIHKRGYRLIGAVTPATAPPAAAHGLPLLPSRRRSRRWAAAAAVIGAGLALILLG